MIYAPVTFDVATSNSLGGDAFSKKIHYFTFDFDIGFKVTRNIAQYPLDHVICASTTFEVAKSYGLGEDTITRYVADGQTDGRRTDFGTKSIYHIFSNEKAGIITASEYDQDMPQSQTHLQHHGEETQNIDIQNTE